MALALVKAEKLALAFANIIQSAKTFDFFGYFFQTNYYIFFALGMFAVSRNLITFVPQK